MNFVKNNLITNNKKMLTQLQNQIIDFLYYLITGIRSGAVRWNDDYVKMAIRHYPTFNKAGVETWKNVDLYKLHHKISVRAGKILDNPSAVWNDVYYEHIEPVSYTKDVLKKTINNNLYPNITRNDIVNTMSGCEVIIISPEEQQILDGSHNKQYPLDDNLYYGFGLRNSGSGQDRWDALANATGAAFDPRYIYNTL